MVKVLVKKLNPAVEIPTYKTSGASGMDLMAFIEKPIKLAPKSSCLVPISKMKLEEVKNLPETLRGKGGFGSTGK